MEKVYKYNSLLIFPFLTGIGLVAPDFILVAYGEKWLPILVPLRMFCIYGILRMYSQPLQVLCNGIGKPNLPFKWSLIFVPFNLLLLYIGVTKGGTSGAVLAKMVLPVFMAVTVGRIVMREIELPWLRLIGATWPALAGCLAMSVVVGTLDYILAGFVDNALLRLGLLVTTGALIYVGILMAFFRSDLNKVLELVNRFKSNSS